VNPDVFLATGVLGVCLAAAVIVFVLVDGALERRRRPYLAARLDEKTGDWADERSDMSLADLDLCNRLWDLPAYSGDDHTTTNPTGES
jgi:hypothetical protein